MGGIKDLLLHKLTLRIAAFGGTFLAMKTTNFLTGDEIHSLLTNIFVDPTLKPGAEGYIRGLLELGITVLGATGYHFVHEKLILPHVQSKGETPK